MKRMVWTDRVRGIHPTEADYLIKDQGVSLPSGPPSEGWKRENGSLVEICAEQFPGATPVWIWEE